MRRTEAMNDNLKDLLNDDLKACKFLSLQFDESTNISDIAQLCIFVRMVFEDMTSKEELLTIIPLKRQMRGLDSYNSFKNFIDKTGFPNINWFLLQQMELQRWSGIELVLLPCAIMMRKFPVLPAIITFSINRYCVQKY
ncbi:general transcription factor II-I repeat domain-containing 2A-like protein [Trichonephila clavipes]|nr:general transcription factor II-I repeat domain-containing 2A-like protein [Trichonephila clavipes]